MDYKSYKIKIDGVDYWYLQNNLEGLSGPIAPLDHCDSEGNLDFSKCFLTESFAHVRGDGSISRFGKHIGNIKDFIEIKN